MAQIEDLPLAPDMIRDAAVRELESLTRLVEEISMDAWPRASGVAGWTVGDVVAHLALYLGMYSRLLGTVLAGGGSGRLAKTIGWVTASVMPTAAPIFNMVNGALPRVMDQVLAPEVVKGQFLAGARTTQERLLQMGPEDYPRPVSFEGGPYPLSFYLAIAVNELAIHRWDIEAGLGGRAELSDDARRILPWFYWSGTRLMLRLPPRTTGTVQVLLTDPDAALWWSVSGGAVKLGRETIPEPDTTIHGPSGPYILTLAGRLQPATSLQSSLVLAGDRVLAERFLRSWHII